MRTPQDEQESRNAALAKVLREAQAERRTASYAESTKLRAGWAVDRYRALRAEGMDRLDALVIAGQVF